jgi:phage baseplate assembly protein V
LAPRDIAKMIKKLMEPWVRSIQLSIGRCVLNFVTDSTGIQVVQTSLLAGEIKDMERMQQYGFTSAPLPGAEGVAVFVGGNRENGIVIAMDDRRYRLKNLGAGKVALYDSTGSQIVMENDGNITVEAGGKVDVICDSAEIAATGEARITAADAVIDATNIELGDSAAEAVVKGDAFKALYDAHTHVGSAPGSPTSPPSVPMGPAQLSTIAKVGG